MPASWRKLWGCAPGRSSGHFGVPRDPGGEGQAWVTHVDDDEPRKQTGIRYFPETDTFLVPSYSGGGREVPGKDFLQIYPGGDAGDLRRRRLDELKTTGRIANRETDRWGNPWPADRYVLISEPWGHHHHHNSHYYHHPPHGKRNNKSHHSVGHRQNRGKGPRSDVYSVELPYIPEEPEVERAPLLLTQYPHWGGSSGPGHRKSSKSSSRAPSQRLSRR